jgi:hypothetical protein
MSTVNEILEEHSESNSKIKLQLLPPEEFEQAGYALIEGDREALQFLAKLLLAQSEQGADCGLQIHPNGPGKRHFEASSNLGIYIHVIPCSHNK